MKRPLALGLAALGALLLAVLHTHQSAAHSLRDVARKTAARTVSDTLPTLWFVFRPSDCLTNTARFDTLNALSSLGKINVRGVILLDDPTARPDIERMLPLFRANFPILPDAHGEWYRAADREGLRPPFYALQNATGDLAILAPDELTPGTPAFKVIAGDTSRFEQQLMARRAQVPNHRHFLAATLAPTILAAGETKVTLNHPEGLTGSSRRVAMFDFGSSRVIDVDDTGQLLWTYPAAGDTIEPFLSVADIKMWQDSVGVLDDARNQVVVLSPSGRAVRTLRFSRSISRFARITEGRTIAIDERQAGMRAYVFGPSGQLQHELIVPASIARLPSLVREARLVTLPGSDSVLVAFRNASQIWVMDPRNGLRPFTTGPEHVEFPTVVAFRGRGRDVVLRLDPRAVRATSAIQADEDGIYVLFAGETSGANRQVDVFARSDGRYRGSYRLGSTVSDMARVSGAFVTLATIQSSPSPSLVRWHEREAPGRSPSTVATGLDR